MSNRMTYDIGSQEIRKLEENLKFAWDYNLVASILLKMKLLSILVKNY